MTKELIIERLKKTIEKAELLDPSEFNYRQFVSKTNEDQTCGTVCCIAGWYPKWFPDAGIRWADKISMKPLTDNNIQLTTDHNTISDCLCDYHGFKSVFFIYSLFYGLSLTIKGETVIPYIGTTYVSLDIVISRFKKILSEIKQGNLDSYLNLS